MSPKIVVEIDDQGRVQADFIGYAGRSCEGDEARLRQELARLGIEVQQAKVTPKSKAQIAQEIRQDQPIKRQKWTKVKV